jgi:two-component system, chemotaxis family, CheB/CheR fusion protein
MKPADAPGRPSGDDPGPLVVIGSSAGGIDALSALAAQLPADFPAPVVIAQHLQAGRRSRLGEILARRTALTVISVEHREELRPGYLYAVPSNHHVDIQPGSVGVTAPGDGGPTPSVDRLLATAAEAYGESVVAVVLTGTGSDGASGARDVKAAGGAVVIQNPETAAYAAMPASLAPSTVDVVAELDAMGPLLEELVAGTRLPRERGDERTLDALLSLLRERSGVDFGAYKRPTIMRRLQRRLVATRSGELRQYLRLVQRSPEEYQRLASSFLIKVTGFFRDAELFDHLRDSVLPQLVEEATRRERRELRIWSAGCATGEEAYSLAILAAQATGSRKDLDVRIFATDLDAEAVAFARRGIYPPAAVAAVPESILNDYFIASDGSYEISKRVRSSTVFGQHDLAQQAPFPSMDLVLCRNVLIYFTSDLQRRALQLFAFSLRDAGYLVLGKAETAAPLPEYFALVDSRLKVFRRRGERGVMPTGRFRDRPSALRDTSASSHVHPVRGSARPVRDARGSGGAEGLLFGLPVGVAAIDRDYDILQINAAARRLLGVRGNATGRDLVHLVGGLPSDELRRHIDRAFAGQASRATFSQTVSVGIGTEPRTLEIRFEPATASVDNRVPTVLLIIDDSTPAEQRASAGSDRTPASDERDRLTERAQTLVDQNEQLLRANEELIAADADLQAANDELLVAHEEAQAATEEVETLNEELQATIEELNVTNEDLESRSAETRELAASLASEREVVEEERARLAAILESMSDAVVVVDARGDIVLTNPAYDRIRTATALYGPEGDPLSPQERPVTRAARGKPFVGQFTSETPDGTRRWYEAAARPIGPAGGGTVLVIRDISERSLREFQEQFLAIASHELRTPLTVLQGYLQMLERQLTQAEDPAPRPPYLVKALSQTRRISELITNFLDVSRLQAGKLALEREEADLAAVVRGAVEVARGLAHEQELRVTGTGPVHLTVDPARIDQVILNLLLNAFDAVSIRSSCVGAMNLFR